MSKLKEKLDALKSGRRYHETKFILEVIDAISDCLDSSKMKKTEVAEKLGLSKGRVSQYFSGQKNLTLRTLAAILWAMGKQPRIVIDDAQCESERFHFIEQCFVHQFPSSSTKYNFDIDTQGTQTAVSA